MPRLGRVTFDEFEVLVEQARTFHNSLQEPIPAIGKESRKKVEAALAAPFATFGGKDLHKGTKAKCAALFYGLAKGHALENGNKRMAIFTLAYFLMSNGYAITMSNREVADLAEYVAESKAADHQEVVQYILRTLAYEYGQKITVSKHRRAWAKKHLAGDK